MIARLEYVWQKLRGKGVDRDRLLAQSLLSPATCCLVNPDIGVTVEKAFAVVKKLSETLRETYGLA